MKRAIVTGGSSGLGYACAEVIGSAGYQVTSLSRRNTSAPGVACLPLDLSNSREIDAMAARLRSKGDKIDILVNNAGISPAGRVQDFSEQDFDATMQVNFSAARLLIEGLRPLLQGGVVINIVSRVGYEGRHGLCAYGVSKGMLIGYTQTIAAELAQDNVRIYGVNPGFIITGMVTEKAIARQKGESLFGSVSDVHAAARFILMLAQSEWSTGAIYDFDSRVYNGWHL
ncbi:MAG: hypothetical protein A2268_11000 [Candidatus Raymondbacteria bacterium RifOxyA12_full_50_37]|uniref:Short-chain dehydrogenase n=1 Tax=Candidatus Raymondbacteria bacterium RIFOXYD12_FULL_49_13 TaxID=1817890 RepID=A0A1F7F211_UNCRA|nr:MAG: hypothetical protein A2268_11000 [Candidatus Raymondbacteria bacterium RifOxyA12_full_50_37]OGJ85538.1 MAG: hypothetical protein A2248_12785 [Candidatus Raymondbacteria bacterium RIFOXYA2_FULL_49_16]OGJ94672.1 MAG: hypothetical protein A2487_08010 [Candidatus Raymondbacteria bacterium RifOxyC12_full_50_8]OGJ95041.1 MAG: hypothetical protein A2453_07485 [Candidatus Raymondbacteria bacterium RIFOXYC2_FULL_50_21]OGK00705.1 MAG: hypothetical protein A2519_20130 [Candidatus Raymondbacteria b